MTSDTAAECSDTAFGQASSSATLSRLALMSMSKAPRDWMSILIRMRIAPPSPEPEELPSASGSTHISANIRLPFQFSGSMVCWSGM